MSQSCLDEQRQAGSLIIRTLKCALLGLLVFLVTGCGNKSDAKFVNPNFDCPTPQIVESQAGYPHPIQQYPFAPNDYEKSVSELKEFCSRMKKDFSDSNLTITEAEQFYSLLNNDKIPWLHNECYGMPVCDTKPFVVSEQVMVKKVSNEKYEIFFYYIGCGTNYDYMEVLLAQGKVDGYNIIERWSETYPC